MSAVKLAFGRFYSFLTKYNYALVSVYCEKESQIRFAECRTPEKQKTFIIYIPKKYSLVLPSKSNTKAKYLNLASENLESRQIRYLIDLKGTMVGVDLVAISGSELTWYQEKDKGMIYDIGDSPFTEPEEEQDSEEEIEPEEEVEEILELEKEASELIERVDPSLKDVSLKSQPPQDETPKDEPPLETPKDEPPKDELPKDEPPKDEAPSETSPKDKLPEDKAVEVSEEVPEVLSEDEDSEEDSDSEVQIELVFEDAEGESVEDITEFIDQEDSEGEIVEEDEGGEPGMDMKYSDIVLGITYPAINLGAFFRKASTYEKEVISACEQINTGVLDIRKTKLQEVKDLTAAFLSRAEERLEEINGKEKKLRLSLTRLAILQVQTESLQKSINKNPKLESEKPEVKKLHDQTRKYIQDLNIDLLRLQDDADELLNNYQSSIKELMEL